MKQLYFFEEMLIDNFAGGGGASTGIELATRNHGRTERSNDWLMGGRK